MNRNIFQFLKNNLINAIKLGLIAQLLFVYLGLSDLQFPDIFQIWIALTFFLSPYCVTTIYCLYKTKEKINVVRCLSGLLLIMYVTTLIDIHNQGYVSSFGLPYPRFSAIRNIYSLIWIGASITSVFSLFATTMVPKQENRKTMKLLNTLVIVAFLMIVTALLALPNTVHPPRLAAEVSASGTLRELRECFSTLQRQNIIQPNAPNFLVLKESACMKTRFDSNSYVTYRFEVLPSKDNTHAFPLEAIPLNRYDYHAGLKAMYLDEQGRIHVTEYDRKANETDPIWN